MPSHAGSRAAAGLNAERGATWLGEDRELCTCEDESEGRLLQVDDNYTLNVTVDGGEASASFIVNHGESVLPAGAGP